MKTEEKFKHLWRTTKTSSLGERLFLISEERMFPVLEEIKLSKNAKIIDAGCGCGRTLQLFRMNGYHDSIGIDISEDSIRMCEGRGFVKNKDVFLDDVKSKKLKPKSYQLVFAEGLLEHFVDMQPTVDAMCRLSKRYILILQPNHTTISLKRYIYRLFEIIYVSLLRREHIHEIPYIIDSYEVAFNKNGFYLFRKFDLVMNSGWGLLFRKI